MNRKALIAITALSAAAFAAPAMAQRMSNMSSAYVGGSIGQSKFKGACDDAAAGISCDDKDTAFRLFGGYQFNRNIAAELGYASLGKVKISGPGFSGDVEGTAWDLSAVGSWPFTNEFSVIGRLGLARTEGKGGGDIGGSDNKNAVTFGLGAQYDFSRNLGLRGEWQRYKVNAAGDDSDVDVLSVGVLWRFR